MNLREKLENLMVAISFAEAGESETARQVLEREKHVEKRERVTAPREEVLERKELRAPSIQR
jgi:hypothetical protein